MKQLLGVFTAAIVACSAQANDPNAGKEKATVCSACHGESGVSVSDTIPNLAGQKAKYLATQLSNFRAGKRANPLMSAIAAQLSDADIDNLAAHFSSLQSGSPGEKSPILFDATRVGFPADYKQTFTQYTTSNRADNNTVRYLFANDAALQGAVSDTTLPSGAVIVMEVYKAKLDADDQPITGSDGVYEQNGLAGYAVMEKRNGWGDAYAEELRNGDWSYAFFTPQGDHKAGINEAACLACHQPLGDQDYLFSSAALQEKAQQ